MSPRIEYRDTDNRKSCFSSSKSLILTSSKNIKIICDNIVTIIFAVKINMIS